MSMFKDSKLSSNLREKFLNQIKDESNNSDSRRVNYFDLEMGQQMEVLLLPDATGELFYEYSTHSVKRAGVSTINCPYTSSREDCAICSYGWDIYSSPTGTKEESSKWRRKQHWLAQAIILKSPIETLESEDGNLVKLFYMPFAIKELIVDSVINETVKDPSERVLVIKKSKNQGGRASYEKSFFKPEPYQLDKDMLEAFDAGLIKSYDLRAELPAPTHSADSVEWMTNALRATPFRVPVQGETDEESAEANSTLSPGQKSEPAGTTEPAAPVMSLRERLNKKRLEGQGQ